MSIHSYSKINEAIVDEITHLSENKSNLILQGFSEKDAFLVTQTPLPHTKEDFIRLIYDRKFTTVAMINKDTPKVPVCNCSNCINALYYKCYELIT